MAKREDIARLIREESEPIEDVNTESFCPFFTDSRCPVFNGFRLADQAV